MGRTQRLNNRLKTVRGVFGLVVGVLLAWRHDEKTVKVFTFTVIHRRTEPHGGDKNSKA